MDNPTEIMIGGDHYDITGVTPRIYAMKNGLDPDGANIVKYIWRARRKGQFSLDIRKAIHVTKLRQHWLATGRYSFAYKFTGHYPISEIMSPEVEIPLAIAVSSRLTADQMQALSLAEDLFMVEIDRRLTPLRRDVARDVKTILLVRHLQTMLDGEPNAS